GASVRRHNCSNAKEHRMFRLISKFLLGCAAIGASVAGSANGWTPQQSNSTAEPMAGTTASAEQKVTIDNFAFEPQILTVAPGTKVTWVNRDDVPDTATSSDSPQKFNSKALDTDQ